MRTLPVLVVPVPVMLRWSERRLCWLLVIYGVVQALVVPSARRAHTYLMRTVVQITARCAARGPLRSAIQIAGSSYRVVVCRCDTLLRVLHVSARLARRTRRCSGRALRHEIGGILERGIVWSVNSIQTARR